MNQSNNNPTRRYAYWLVVLCCLLQVTAHAQCPVYTAPAYDNVSYRDYFTGLTASVSAGTSSVDIGGGTPDVTYVNYVGGTSPQGISAPVGATISLNVTRCSTPYTAYLGVYVDWNHDGQFDSTELVGSVYEFTPYTTADVYTFTLPVCAVGYTYPMRVMLSEVTGNHLAPCHSNWGQALDFYITPYCPLPLSITGGGSVCNGATTTLASQVGCGTWTSSNPSVATVDPSTGVLSGIVGGTTTISYTTASCGSTSTIVTVNPMPITGNLITCTGYATTLSCSPAGFLWTVSSGAIMNFISAGGGAYDVSIFSMTAGNYTVTYTYDGCTTSAVVQVLTSGSFAISGASVLCPGATTSLTSVSPLAGAWGSDVPSVATVNSSTGVVTGISGGTATIYFAPAGLGGTCVAYHGITVDQPVLVGSTTVCIGSPTTFTVTGSSGGGTWSSSNPSIASVGASTGVVSGSIVGGATLTYTSPNGCIGTKGITVAAPPNISGSSLVCQGNTITMAGAPSGGTFASSSTSLATVSSSGVVTGVSSGSVTISYTRGGCAATIGVAVGVYPAITGSSSVNCGFTTTLSSSPPGATWSSSNTSIAGVSSSTGVVTGVSAGVATISYSGTDYVGGHCYGTHLVTVNPVTMSGASSVCTGSTIGMSVSSSGGTFSSSNTSIATVNSSGVVSGVSAGTATITYAFSGVCYAIHPVTVNQTPTVSALSLSSVCTGVAVNYTMSPAMTDGTWSSSNTGIAEVTTGIGSFGYVTGVSAGTALISYTSSAGCVGSYPVTINPTPNIFGASTVCAGTPMTLSPSISGGTWSSTNTSIAIVSSTGVITAVTTGTVTISYQSPSGCINSAVVGSYNVSLSGPPSVCGGSAGYTPVYVLSASAGGGTWTSSNTAIATVSGGNVTCLDYASGNVTITYSIAVCTLTHNMNVVARPYAISDTYFSFSDPSWSAVTLKAKPTGGSWDPSGWGLSISATGIVSDYSTATINSTGSIPATVSHDSSVEYRISDGYATCPVDFNFHFTY